MATYNAIAATSDAIRRLLDNACPRDDFPGVDFKLFQSSDFKEGMDFGISIYLYRVAVNTTHRNRQPRIGLDGRRYLPPMPLDLFYLLSAWASEAKQQQRLLGWAVRTLEDTPTIPSGFLNLDVPVAETFGANETVEVVMDVVAPADMHNLWDAFRISQQRSEQLSVTYVARMVLIESTVSATEQGLAQTRVFEYHKLESR